MSRRLGPPGRLFFATVRRRAPSATTHSSLDRLSARRAELQTRTEYSTIHRTQTHRTEGRSFESTTTSPLWIPFVSPHAMRGVHEPHSYFSVPSHDVHSRTPLSPDRAAELRSCAPHASRMPLRFCRPPRPAASAGRLRHSEPPSAWRSARRLLPGAQHGAFCLALSTAPSAWRSARRLLPGSSSALSLALGTALSNRGGSGEDPARVP